MKIKSVQINRTGLEWFVVARLENGSEHNLFGYYPDEISFAESEFVGLTVDEALELHRKRDIAYLQS